MKRISLAVILVAQFCSLLHAQAGGDVKSLKGIAAVALVLEPVDPELEREGLSGKEIQKEVSLRLKQGGIRILGADESGAAPGRPQLYLAVNAWKSAAGIYSYTLELSLQQRVNLERNPQLTTLATTWTTGSFGIVGASKIGGIVGKIADLADDFLEIWNEANPKKQSPPADRMPSSGHSVHSPLETVAEQSSVQVRVRPRFE